METATFEKQDTADDVEVKVRGELDSLILVYCPEFSVKLIGCLIEVFVRSRPAEVVVSEALDDHLKQSGGIVSLWVETLSEYNGPVLHRELNAALAHASATVSRRDQVRAGGKDFANAVKLFTTGEKFAMLLVYAALELEANNISEYSVVIDKHIIDKQREIIAEIWASREGNLSALCGIIDAADNCEQR